MASLAAATAKRTIWARTKSIPVEYPFAFGFVLSGFKTSFSDLLVQTVVEQKQKVMRLSGHRLVDTRVSYRMNSPPPYSG